MECCTLPFLYLMRTVVCSCSSDLRMIVSLIADDGFSKYEENRIQSKLNDKHVKSKSLFYANANPLLANKLRALCFVKQALSCANTKHNSLTTIPLP